MPTRRSALREEEEEGSVGPGPPAMSCLVGGSLAMKSAIPGHWEPGGLFLRVAQGAVAGKEGRKLLGWSLGTGGDLCTSPEAF